MLHMENIQSNLFCLKERHYFPACLKPVLGQTQFLYNISWAQFYFCILHRAIFMASVCRDTCTQTTLKSEVLPRQGY